MKLVVTTEAKGRLIRLMAFYRNIYTPAQFRRIRANNRAAIEVLTRYPRGGALEPYLEYMGKGHRRMVVGQMKILYYISGNVLYVTDFFDGRQDPGGMKG